MVVGLVVMLRPYERSFGVVAPDNVSLALGTTDCGVPFVAAFSTDAADGSGWFAYAPGTNPVFSGRFGCQASARVRAGLGSVMAILGAATVVLAARNRRRTRS